MRKWKIKGYRGTREFAMKNYRIFHPGIQKKISIKSTKRIKGKKENSKKDFLNSRQSTEFLLEVKREELENCIYYRRWF